MFAKDNTFLIEVGFLIMSTLCVYMCMCMCMCLCLCISLLNFMFSSKKAKSMLIGANNTW